MEMIMQALETALQVIICTAVPILTALFVSFIRAKAAKIKLDTDNQLIDTTISLIEGVITKAVTFVSQTYVDALKKDGRFSVEEQKIAFSMAYNRVMELVSEEQQELISSLFGNFADWVSMLIESAVREQKTQAA